MNTKFPAPASTNETRALNTLEDIRIELRKRNPKDYRLRAFRRLETLLGMKGMPLLLPATEAGIREVFPKVKKGIHPRPDLDIQVENYRRTIGDVLNALRYITGEQAVNNARKAMIDDWTNVRQALELHTKEGGIIHASSLICMDKLIDLCRLAGLIPRDFAKKDFLDVLVATCPTNRDYYSARNALKLLEKYRHIEEISACLPSLHVPQLPTPQSRKTLPEAVEDFIENLLINAYFRYDEILGKDVPLRTKSTIECARSALRYHFKTLLKCPSEPKLGFPEKIETFSSINDLTICLAKQYIFATLRYTINNQKEENSIEPITALQYYNYIIVVMSRNEFEIDEIISEVRATDFIAKASEEKAEMNPEVQEWCRQLLTNSQMERRFRNFHLISKEYADRLLTCAQNENRQLSSSELKRVRQYGTIAAACAIEYAGRPIRSTNVRELRLKGQRRNFFTPTDRSKRAYGFALQAGETKANTAAPFTELRSELYGPKVLSWYLDKIRPLYPHANTNIYLFPGIENEGQCICKETFRIWFQQAASAAKIPMTFHYWRHGYGSLLMAEGWENLQLVADMLGNTLTVADKKYVFILKEKLYRAGQNITISGAQKHKKRMVR